MNRFIKTETSTEVLYFRTFKDCLVFFGKIDKSKFDSKDNRINKPQKKIYTKFYRKLEYWDFTNVNFSFGITSRINFTNTD